MRILDLLATSDALPRIWEFDEIEEDGDGIPPVLLALCPDGRYEVRDGHRRLAYYHLLGRDTLDEGEYFVIHVDEGWPEVRHPRRGDGPVRVTGGGMSVRPFDADLLSEWIEEVRHWNYEGRRPGWIGANIRPELRAEPKLDWLVQFDVMSFLEKCAVAGLMPSSIRPSVRSPYPAMWVNVYFGGMAVGVHFSTRHTRDYAVHTPTLAVCHGGVNRQFPSVCGRISRMVGVVAGLLLPPVEADEPVVVSALVR